MITTVLGSLQIFGVALLGAAVAQVLFPVLLGHVTRDDLLAAQTAREADIPLWREKGGPEPETDPERKGFGSTLISRVIAMLNGEAHVAYPSTGAMVTMTIPMRAIAKPMDDAEPADF